MKKIISLTLTITIVLSSFVISVNAEDKKLNYLLLGDSITEGFGVANPDQASYGKIVADTNGWNYANESRMARDSDRLLYMLNNTYQMIENVKKADVISLSIGANDYLANDEVVALVAGALFGLNNKKLNAIADNYYNNLCLIIDRIKELNPNAVILMQNYYNAWSGFAYIAYNAGSERVNKMIYKYIDAHSDAVTLCDISPAMKGHKEYLADDCVHPNAKGNIAIAKLVLKQLYDMGIGTAVDPVINAEGIDYNYFESYIDERFGGLITVIVKILTGNAVNLFR